MNFSRLATAICLLNAFGFAACSLYGQQTPTVHDPRFKLELFCREPQIVTPIGAAFDHQGRLLVIESHTHQRPGNYQGPEKDRIRIVEDADGDGAADRFRTYYEGTEATMSLARGPGNWIYVATRMKIFRIRDTNEDDQADEEQTLVHLETKGNYPHNGLCGLAFDGQGNLVFGIGENLGAAYKMIGSDGASLSGSGEGGVFRTDLAGKNLSRIATGFWNPFGICIDSHDRIFAVGNDPDGSPPCRLVQVVETGDYGFQFRYGRGGRHPLQAWNGEIPGTLPMLAGTGEAPCEMVIHHGRLWVASWGHNRIERYELIPLGASFQARREVVVQGNDQFRPVGFALAADGSLYVTDWVDKSYPVHGKGRIWRLSYQGDPPGETLPPLSDVELRARAAARKLDWEALKSDDLFLRQAAIGGLVHSAELETAELSKLGDARQRLSLLQALRWKLDHSPSIPAAPPVALLKEALHDQDQNVRYYAVRWAADANLKELREDIDKLLTEDAAATPVLLTAAIGALQMLDTGRNNFGPDTAGYYFVEILKDEKQSAARKNLALRMVPPDFATLELTMLRGLLAGEDEKLKRETVRLLVLSTRAERFEILKAIAADENNPEELRADAVLGLAADAKTFEALFQQLVAGEKNAVSHEAAKALNQLAGDKQEYEHPPSEDLEAWMNVVAEKGNADSGWRVFFGHGAARCANCHRCLGRGSNVGPDLTAIAARTPRRQVLQSLLQPSRDMAPQFVPSLLLFTDGKVRQGIWQGYDDQKHVESFLAADGSIFAVDPAEIEQRTPATVSIMPENLHRRLSLQEIRDLLELLEEN